MRRAKRRGVWRWPRRRFQRRARRLGSPRQRRPSRSSCLARGMTTAGNWAWAWSFSASSRRIYASLVGLNTTVTYFTNDWFAVEGNLVTGFAPEIYDREHVKYFGGGRGVRIGSRRARWEPWGHALVGGGHLQPQTAGASRTALM